jgi:hypothetical protein
MKKFDNIILETTYVNLYGETMRLVIDDDDNMWFYHSDCNEDFEPLIELVTHQNSPFKYILNKGEKLILTNFMNVYNEMLADA